MMNAPNIGDPHDDTQEDVIPPPCGHINITQYFTLWLPADSNGLQPECWNSIWNLLECLESIIPPDFKFILPDSKGHSNTFQVHSAGFQPIPTRSMGHSKGHSNP